MDFIKYIVSRFLTNKTVELRFYRNGETAFIIDSEKLSVEKLMASMSLRRTDSLLKGIIMKKNSYKMKEKNKVVKLKGKRSLTKGSIAIQNEFGHNYLISSVT